MLTRVDLPKMRAMVCPILIMTMMNFEPYCEGQVQRSQTPIPNWCFECLWESEHAADPGE